MASQPSHRLLQYVTTTVADLTDLTRALTDLTQTLRGSHTYPQTLADLTQPPVVFIQTLRDPTLALTDLTWALSDLTQALPDSGLGTRAPKRTPQLRGAQTSWWAYSFDVLQCFVEPFLPCPSPCPPQVGPIVP